MEILELLKECGMEAAVQDTTEKLEKRRKLHLAYQNFPFVTNEAVEAFKAELKKKTETFWDKAKKKQHKTKPSGGSYVRCYDTLKFTNLKAYPSVPPVEALQRIKAAKEMGIFDEFAVAKIESVQEVIDPIVFGMINGCSDVFHICVWGEDVKFADLSAHMKKEL